MMVVMNVHNPELTSNSDTQEGGEGKKRREVHTQGKESEMS